MTEESSDNGAVLVCRVNRAFKQRGVSLETRPVEGQQAQPNGTVVATVTVPVKAEEIVRACPELDDGDAPASFKQMLQRHGVRSIVLGHMESGGVHLLNMNDNDVTGLEQALAPGGARAEAQ